MNVLELCLNPMYCSKIEPPEFTKEQIAKCQECKHASGKKIWCCYHGVRIIERGRVFTPAKKIRPPRSKLPLTTEQLLIDYERVKSATAKKGVQVINWSQYLNHRRICIKCNGGYKCPHYCCGIQAQVALVTWQCKKGKF